MRRSPILLLALLLVAADPAPEEAIKKEKAKLQGTWVNLHTLFEPGPPVLLVFTFTADKLQFASYYPDLDKEQLLKETGIEATFTLDPAKEPKTIEVKLTAGRDKGKTLRGFYQFTEDRLKLYLAEKPVPANFNREALVCKRSTAEEVKKSVANLEKLLAEQEAATKLRKAGVPLSRMAKPIDRAATNNLTLELDIEGNVKVPGRDAPLDTLAQVRDYLKEQYREREAKVGAGKVRTVVLFRAHREADAGALREVAQLCVREGFAQLFLRVATASSQEGQLELLLPQWRRLESFAGVSISLATIGNQGQLFRIVVGYDTETQMELPILESTEKNLSLLGSLERYLEKRPKDLANKESVELRPESKVKIGPLVETCDVCLKAGFSRLVLGLPPDSEREPKPLFRAKVPPKDVLARAEQEIKAIYQPLYARPNPAELARYLRKAADVCDEAAARFVLLREAADAADRAGKLSTSLEILGQLEESFPDAAPQKLIKLSKAPPSEAVVDLAIQEASQASLRKQPELGARFLKLAERAAKKLNDQNLIAFVEERRQILGLPRLGDNVPLVPPVKPVTPPVTSVAAVKSVEKAPDERPPASDSLPDGMWWVVGPAAAGIVLFGGGLIWWLRRGDRAVRSRLAVARKVELTLPDTEETAEPPAAFPSDPNEPRPSGSADSSAP